MRKSSSNKIREMPSERVGDWVCLNCENVNYGFRKECNRCSLLRTDVGKTIATKEELEKVHQTQSNN